MFASENEVTFTFVKILYRNHIIKDHHVVVAQIESLDLEYLRSYGFEWEESDGLLSKKAESFMARKLLCKELDLDLSDLGKEGKRPVLLEKETEISISHSDRLVAIAYGRNRVGLDIESKWQKLKVIQHKFVNDLEREFVRDTRDTSVIWGAKESMFKIYSKGSVSYLNDLNVSSFKGDSGTLNASVKKELSIRCRGLYDWVRDSRLVALAEVKG